MSRTLIRIAALVSFSWFLWDAVDRGWSHPSTDFPNYYTAALLAHSRQPLHHYYEWTWFQRQLDFAGADHRLGGYIPQTPLTMAPFVPLSFFSPLTARRIWFVLNFAFLGISLLLISKMTRFTIAQLWLLAFLGCISLRTNFVLGQYYIFLLALMTVAVYCLLGRREWASGLAFGATVALKLYGAPTLLFAACCRRWRVVFGMTLALLLSAACSVAIFGAKDVLSFAAQVLPRALQGETLNPYHPSNGSATTMLRSLFVAQPELNPAPLTDSPGTFLFLSTLFALCVALFPAIAGALRPGIPSKRTIAWWVIAMLLISPNTASYTFVLLILPVALLLGELPGRTWCWPLAAYFALTLPLWPAWSWAFPKVWLLLALFLIAGWSELKLIPVRAALPALAACALGSGAVDIAGRQPQGLRTPEATEKGAIYSAFPVASREGLLYESIGTDRYVLRRGQRRFAFDGDAFHPSVPDNGGPIYFELVHGRHSAIMRFDDQTGQSTAVPVNVPDPREPAVSHDGKTLAFTSGETLYTFDGSATRRIASRAHDPSFLPGDRALIYARGGVAESIQKTDLRSGLVTTLAEGWQDIATPSVSPDGKRLLFAARRGANWQVWMKEFESGHETKITSGNCNNRTPAWDGSRQIVFASDCRRGLGLPALFRTSFQ